MEISHNSIDLVYHDLCCKLLRAPRVGNTKEINNVKFTIRDIDKNVVRIRNISLQYLCGELAWYFSGRRDTKFIAAFSKFWNKITDDGENANSAYGYLIKSAFGFDQVEKVIKLLEKDPNSRRAKININTPNERVIETKDEPCTMFLQFMIRDGKLDCTAVMRSNDIWLGLPYDVAFFTEVQKYIARRLHVKYGTYTHFAVSLHVYERNIRDIERIAHHVEYGDPIIINNDELVAFAPHVARMVEEFMAMGVDPKEKIVEIFKHYCILA